MRSFYLWLVFGASISMAAEPVSLRMETLTVPPSTQPLAFVIVTNRQASPFTGRVALQGPAAWRMSPSDREVNVQVGESQRVAFNIEKGRNVEANTYAFQMTASNEQTTVTCRQETFVASAPYFKVVADGMADEWKDAIPVTFQSGGKTTSISTYWNRRSFSLLVGVEEEKLLPYDAGGRSSFDAVQFSLAPLDPPSDAGEATAQRFEFLLAATDGAPACFQLAKASTPVDDLRCCPPLDSLAYEDADLAIRRDGETTWYECTLSFRPLRDSLTPSEGREFYFSVLVHDPDGTGIRDLGDHAQLPPPQADSCGWRRWPGAVWGEQPPREPRIRWGMCTSKY